ncbi:TetR/AcrR family transcriptional regulator [Paenibacillus macerans]|uniref:TetR/AcrR family transcriptional regulator n=1 Tax=Paenibacillus macerans TaxID=44252 RepID=UPI0020413FD4|nr:TetR/AcrR family transcriptional regulator [Paenibacillus macerans]MCM3699628.1 TetR/AcrR family transcriptional regulator [Paenibacillus macerans]
MKESITDLRIIRTKQSIRDALVELLDEKGFEGITVKDITTRAKINRSTFYTHYLDKFDLMTKCQEEIMYELSRIVKLAFPSVIGEITTKSQTLSAFIYAVPLFEYLNENRKFLKAALSSKGDLSFQTKLKDFIWKTLFENNSGMLLNEKDLLVPAHYLSSYISSAFIGVVQQWLNNDCKESPEVMARILSTITMNGPYFAAGLKK